MRENGRKLREVGPYAQDACSSLWGGRMVEVEENAHFRDLSTGKPST
jgi:hypothetical protein